MESPEVGLLGGLFGVEVILLGGEEPEGAAAHAHAHPAGLAPRHRVRHLALRRPRQRHLLHLAPRGSRLADGGGHGDDGETWLEGKRTTLSRSVAMSMPSFWKRKTVPFSQANALYLEIYPLKAPNHKRLPPHDGRDVGGRQGMRMETVGPLLARG